MPRVRDTGVRTVLADLSRGLTAAGVLLSAAVHLQLWDVGGFSHLDTIGPLFLLNAVAGVVIGVAVVTWRHWLPLLLAAGFGAATVVAFWISVVHGLFGLHETAAGSAEILAEAAEYGAVLFGVAGILLLGRRTEPARTVPAADTAHTVDTAAGGGGTVAGTRRVVR